MLDMSRGYSYDWQGYGVVESNCPSNQVKNVLRQASIVYLSEILAKPEVNSQLKLHA